MLHTKAQGYKPVGFREEGFRRELTIYGCGGYIGHMTKEFTHPP